MYGETVFVNLSDKENGNRTICDFKCLNCGALLKKEVRYANNKHRCSSFRKNKTEKWCFKCSSWLETEYFHKSEDIYGGYSKACRTCRAKYMVVAEIKRREKDIRQYEPTPDILSRKKASALCSAAQSRANKQNCIFELDPEFIQLMWESQKAKCWYTSLDMKICKTKVGFYSPSIDKLDPLIGYTKQNTVLCLFSVNSFKQNMPVDEFLSLVSKIEWKKINDSENNSISWL